MAASKSVLHGRPLVIKLYRAFMLGWFITHGFETTAKYQRERWLVQDGDKYAS